MTTLRWHWLRAFWSKHSLWGMSNASGYLELGPCIRMAVWLFMVWSVWAGFWHAMHRSEFVIAHLLWTCIFDTPKFYAVVCKARVWIPVDQRKHLRGIKGSWCETWGHFIDVRIDPVHDEARCHQRSSGVGIIKFESHGNHWYGNKEIYFKKQILKEFCS